MVKTDSLMREVWDRNANSFADRFMDLRLYSESLERFLPRIRDGDRVLDLGSGPGNVASWLLSRRSVSLLGIDLSPAMVELSREAVPGARFDVGDIRDLSRLETDSFDHCIAAFCLPFLNDSEVAAFLRDTGALLKPGGYAYFSTMAGEGEHWEVPGFSAGDTFFFNYYSRDFLDTALISAGFCVEDYFEQDYVNDDGSKLIDMFFIARKL